MPLTAPAFTTRIARCLRELAMRLVHNARERTKPCTAVTPSMKTRATGRGSDRSGFVRVRGAREHNLKDLAVEIPRDALVVFTGVSRSGSRRSTSDALRRRAAMLSLESVNSYARRLFHTAGAAAGRRDGLPPSHGARRSAA